MRRLHLVLLASLQLCRARSRSFSIHEDLLAFPQFEVVFPNSLISEKEARVLLDQNDPHPASSAGFAQPTMVGEASLASNDKEDNGAAAGARSGLPLTYELIKMPHHQYLCSIPIIEPPAPENQTAIELAKAEEARELSRAAANGWGLLNQLEGSCLYFMSGWWSYSFCNNREIVQFHALPSSPNGQPPRRDPQTAEYVLGSIPAMPAKSKTHSRIESDDPRVPAELQVKGDQRYLVQRLEGGTICDLTGRERTIEVQYHCVPSMKDDRIGWIKEVTICAYVMVIDTPRLCSDVAFLPPEENKANPITCQLIDDGKQTFPLLDQSGSEPDDFTEPGQQPGERESTQAQGLIVGGVIVGGRRTISGADQDGQPPAKLDPPRSYQKPHQASVEERLIEVLIHAASKEDGGKIDALTAEELEELDLKPEMVEEMRERMRKLAGDAGWQLEFVEVPGNEARELRGWIHTDEEENGEKPAGKAGTWKENKGKLRKGKGNNKAGGKQGGKADDAGHGNGQREDEGSEERFFKEEL